MLSNGQQTLGLAYKTNAQMRQVLQESRSVGGYPGIMTKSHSQINGNNNTSGMQGGKHRNRVSGGQNQKLFAVDGKAAGGMIHSSLTPRKQQFDMSSHRMSNVSQSKQQLIRKQRSTDRGSNNADTTSQGTRLAKSPG